MKLVKLLRHAALILALTTATTFATPSLAAGEVDVVIQEVEAKYAKVEVLKAAFVQTSKSELYGEQTQAGRLTIKRPSKMRWEFEGEQSKQFITDGQTMWIYSAADKQVIRYADLGAQASAADALLQSLDKLHELFKVELAPVPVGAGRSLRLRPLEAEGAQFKSIVLTLDADLGLSVVEIVDAYGGVTELRFTDLVLGGDAPDTLFSFEVPEGVQVIEAGG